MNGVLQGSIRTLQASYSIEPAGGGAFHVVRQVDADATGVVQVSAPEFVVTLALSPEQSERFVFAAEFGHVWLSAQPASVSDDGTRLVTLGNVYSVVR